MEITMSDGLDIKGIDKAELLAGLYNRSKPLGLGFLQATPSDMTAEQARGIIKEQGLDFDYLNGGVMNVNLARGTVLLQSWILNACRNGITKRNQRLNVP